MIGNPQPLWLPLLLLALPGIGFAAYAVNKAVFPPEGRPLCSIPAIGIVLALLPTHILALASGSLNIGLAVAWSAIAAAGYIWIARARKQSCSALSVLENIDPRKLGLTALATVPISIPTLMFNFFDEISLVGHQAMIAHLQNGVYPPRYLYEPSLPLRYHYAFDLAGAIITGLLRVRTDQAIDLLTVILFPCMFLLLWRVGERVGGSRAGLLVALAVSYSAGWCTFCSTFITFYFQHPWSIGVPVFCLVLLQRAALPQLENQLAGLMALGCSLTFLSLCQINLFLTTISALALAELWSLVRSHKRSSAAVLAILGPVLLAARLIGGFFASGPYPRADGLLGTPFHFRDFSSLDTVLGLARQDLALSGLLLIPGVIGLLGTREDRVFLTVLATMGFVVYNSLVYAYSNDSYKFATVSFIALAIGAGVFLSDLARWARSPIRQMIRAALVVALLWKGVFFHFYILRFYNPHDRSVVSGQMIRPYFSAAYPIDVDDARAVNFLRAHMGPSDIVYCTTAKTIPYGDWGGLPTQASVYAADHANDDPYGLGQTKFAARKALDAVSPDWLDRLAAQHVNWVVSDADDSAINTLLESPEGQRRAVLAVRYGNVRVFRVQS
jgi:hypothetical protein